MKKAIILVGKGGRKSAMKVFESISNKNISLVIRRETKSGFVFDQFIRRDDNSIDKVRLTSIQPIIDENTIVIKWGNRIKLNEDQFNVINKMEAVKNASVKNIARKIFMENEVNCPALVTPDSQNLSFPIIARPFCHHAGMNFVVLRTMEEFETHYRRNNENYYYSNFIDKQKEFRAHVAHGKIMVLLEKPRPEDPNMIAWNHAQNNEAWSIIGFNDYDINLCRLAVKAVKVLGLDYGAVDIVIDQAGVPYVLEVNTSPELTTTEYSSTKYGLYFDWLIHENIEFEGMIRPHWESLSYIKAKSFAWKKFNFED